ncbi:MAG TPA: ATP-dependent Clp protease adaptor ClpS [Bacteroidetes bacterium]|mgnify:CR=1 FL=1|nr:ATP-dependent Clp protease adaptor ClpS [Bacteroidota bacterium]
MPVETPDTEVLVEDATATRVGTPWRVILYDDDIHTFEEVILQLMKAVGCTPEQGYKHALTVHTQGKDCVYEGDFEDCFRVQGVLREIQLVTEIEG